jgi:hypothetical protein
VAISEERRYEMYRKFEEVLGTDVASTVMEHLPPVGFADVATKHDLGLLKRDLDAQTALLRHDFDAQTALLRGEIAQLERSFTLELDSMGSRLEARFERGHRQVLTMVTGLMIAGFGATVAALFTR